MAAQLLPYRRALKMLHRALRLFYAGLGLFACNGSGFRGRRCRVLLPAESPSRAGAGLAFLTGAAQLRAWLGDAYLWSVKPNSPLRSLEEEARIPYVTENWQSKAVIGFD